MNEMQTKYKRMRKQESQRRPRWYNVFAFQCCILKNVGICCNFLIVSLLDAVCVCRWFWGIYLDTHTPVQVFPSPEYPVLQVHLKDPTVLAQSASL